MRAVSHETQGERLLSYVVASSNMRYIEINERDIYLRHDPQVGPIVQGEVPGCGSACNANLSQMLLEYTMSCEDCRDRMTTVRYVDHFGERLGKELMTRLHNGAPKNGDTDRGALERGALERVANVMDVIFNSMGVPFQKDLTVEYIRYDLAYCPIHEAARNSGLNLWVAAAHRAFVALCNYVLQTTAPEWVLAHPLEPETDAPLETVLITKK